MDSDRTTRGTQSEIPRLSTWLGLSALLLLSACVGTSPSSSAATPPALALESCQLAAPGFPQRIAAECGAITVYENRAAQSGRQIELRIAILPAIRRDAAPDPLFFLAGGPGQAATESFVQVASAFSAINRTRDIVLVDQRGTGGSHPLRCPLPADLETEPEPTDDQIAAWLTDCAATLDADPTLYTTSIAMDDLDQVRETLGYAQINLYGVSYGTRAALTYLRQYPARVRTLILDGVVPPDLALGLNVARNAQHALDLIVARCAGDAQCHAAFPDLSATFDALMQRLAADPVRLTITHPVSGEPTAVTLDRQAAAFAVRLHSYSPETAALLPLLIYAAQVEDDFEPLAAQSILVSEQLSDAISIGMNLSVLCAEDAPFLDQEAARKANVGSYYGDTETERLFANCAHWPHGEVPTDFKDPIASDVPTLLLSGEADPVTPPANAARVAQTLSNSVQVIAPGQGHAVAARGCIAQIMADFVERASVAGLETGCVDELEPTPFFLSFTGPAP